MTVGVAALLLLGAPARSHVGGPAAVRPVVSGVEPARVGLSASAVFSGEWQVRVSNHSTDEVAILDGAGRRYLLIGPGGVRADYAAPAWYRAATTGAERLPPGVADDSPPDWRRVSVRPEWSWFDPAIRAEPGLGGDRLDGAGAPVRLRGWEIAVRVGEIPGRIAGHLEHEPPVGYYRHRLTSPAAPAAGVAVGLLPGQAIPVVTLENSGSSPVTVGGADGEPFARIGGRDQDVPRVIVEVNLRSPTWLDMARYLQRVPADTADPEAEPRWQAMAEGFRWSWPELRGRPPDEEPPVAVVEAGRPVTVRRWTVPLQIDGRPAELRGETDFVPVTGRNDRGHPLRWAGFAAVVAAAGGAAAAVRRRRRTRGPGAGAVSP